MGNLYIFYFTTAADIYLLFIIIIIISYGVPPLMPVLGAYVKI